MSASISSPLIDTDIKKIRRVAGIGSKHIDTVIAYEQAHWTLLVVLITENSRTDRASFNTGRVQPFGDTVVTPVALVGDTFIFIEVTHAIGAGLYAIAATDAVGWVDQNHTVFGAVGGTRGAHLHTRRVGALVAQLGHKKGFFDLCILVAIGL